MARIEVPMPQMGESIAEGTVSKWIKKVGDAVGRDEPLLEISTDKVDAEIPSPGAGVLAEIVVQEGKTVEVGTVLAYIETEKSAAAAAPQAAPAAPAAQKEPAAAAPSQKTEQPAAEKKPAAAEPERPRAPERAPAAATASAPPAPEAGPDGDGGRSETAEDRLRRRSSPLVRRIAAEHGVDVQEVEGTGYAGRVTKNDILSYLDTRETEPAARPAPATAPTPAAPPSRAPTPGTTPAEGDFWKTFYGQVRHPEFPVREGDRVEPMDRIRRLTADHMVRAKRVAPHVHSFIEIDFTQIDRVRSAGKARWEQQGVKVSYTAFVAWGVARVMPDFPMVNATISGDSIVYRGGVNIGIAVDLNPGLIVPVIKNADELNLMGLAKRINDLAQRAREKKLKPDEVQGATFSITNPGVLGTLVGMPIIPEGTAAILGTGAIEKRVVVVEVDGVDATAIRKRSLFSLGYDHRLVDGADAARFLATLKKTLEAFPDNA
jgi:pyruvate dehydrogenase E2 component (dihydrolipoamide acetyltransferase)